MYNRLLKLYPKHSFFLFGPRGTGKTSWVKNEVKADVIIDLLDSTIYQEIVANPSRLINLIVNPTPNVIVIDEIQRVPELLNEVHRLIEEKKWNFILTGSSARKLKKNQSNLLGGRAYICKMHPLTARELGHDFVLKKSLVSGHLPMALQEEEPKKYLKTYIATYLREEVQQEGLVRNIPAFARFLEAASFSQASILNVSSVARDVGKDRTLVEDYFTILEDLLIAFRLPVFQKKAKRKIVVHPKFYYFDVGVFRAIRPLGPLDDAGQLNGLALETLILQELRAMNDYLDWEFELSFWRTSTDEEVDVILYGEKGLFALEVKAAGRYRPDDLKGLRLFLSDYPMAKCFLLYGGEREYREGEILIVPVVNFLRNPESYLFSDRPH